MKTIYLLLVSTTSISLIICFFCCGCSKIFNAGKDDPLSLPLQPYNGNQLRLDGYYYFDIKGSEDIKVVYFFYRSGVLFTPGAISGNSYPKEESLKDFTFLESLLKNKHSWGIFNIYGDIVYFEKWYPPDGGGWRSYVREGKILNDTTFHITSSYRTVNGKKTQYSFEDEIYHFKEFSPKPDSTNNFLK